MLKYKITTTHGKHPIAEVRSEDERCVIAGEMLLAERGLLQNLLDAVNSVLKDGKDCESFAGNAFFYNAKTPDQYPVFLSTT